MPENVHHSTLCNTGQDELNNKTQTLNMSISELQQATLISHVHSVQMLSFIAYVLLLSLWFWF